MLYSVLSTPGTKARAKYFEVEEYSYTDFMLMNIYNISVAGLDAKPAVKKKHFMKAKNPKNRNKKESTNKTLTVADRKKRVKIAQPPIITDFYHIDKKNVIRRCRKDGVDCSVTNYKHFNNKDDAESFKGEIDNGKKQNS